MRIDSLEDIVRNKIGAILGRGEVRDLIDVLFLDRAGYRTREWWRHALRKEAGLTPEILAHQVSIVAVDAPWPRLVIPSIPRDWARIATISPGTLTVSIR